MSVQAETKVKITKTDVGVREVSRVLLLSIIAGALVFAGTGVLVALMIPVVAYLSWTGFWIGRMFIINKKAQVKETAQEDTLVA